MCSKRWSLKKGAEKNLHYHGLLHLMGYDDATVERAERMKTRQEELLNGFDKAD
ncbi:MAG: rRNA maturation RNAse YbeY [Phycisphaerae bacterium]|nr:rRNA maturation RNAse YbeY [Phycisphaerae bacterium]